MRGSKKKKSIFGADHTIKRDTLEQTESRCCHQISAGRLLLTSKHANSSVSVQAARRRRSASPSKSLCSTAPAPGNVLLKALHAPPTHPPTRLNGSRKTKQNCLSVPLRGPDCCLLSYLCQNNNADSRHCKQTPASLFHKFAERSVVNYVHTLGKKKTTQTKKTKQNKEASPSVLAFQLTGSACLRVPYAGKCHLGQR